MSNDELKSCPFCGGSEYLQVRRRGSMHSSMPDTPMAVLCNNESCEDVWGPTMYGEFDAISAWNTRHHDTRLSTAMRLIRDNTMQWSRELSTADLDVIREAKEWGDG